MKYSEKRRITPKMVVDAFIKTGLTPTVHQYYYDDGVPCACAVGALMLGRHEEELAYAIAERGLRVEFLLAIEEFTEDDYGNGFMRGFDGDAFQGPSKIGYEDGLAARKAVGL